ncbi:Gfo/Idh/MocA family oxidoreductase [Pseudomonas oryzihabitans]|uniref:Gfo/Idh/MocA family oxidoreductase n=1 Tax=Pseudomonas oryzihabitans TaxID=47885 RepID=UPI0028ABE6D1|nr:Gfo/Idh/MocA family oxidoreductase [Pseudomonas oryzihabitans]
MNVLIIGLGYAGHRFWRAFEHLTVSTGIPLRLAYVDRKPKPSELPFFPTVASALHHFKPDIVVVSVNDESHARILAELSGYRGFVLCEKPLATPADDLTLVAEQLSQVSGFALDLVERYSPATQSLRQQISAQGWSLVRASFHWGKDRLNDYRPTCGVTSEVIHALDLVSWICSSADPLQIHDVLGVRSDFSISGHSVLDTVSLTGTLGQATLAGYASFVNIMRQRTVDFSFIDQEQRVIQARLVFDTPSWDQDYLRIWTRNDQGREQLIDEQCFSPAQPGLETLHKLSRLCRHVVRWVSLREMPSQPFADLQTAIALQHQLNLIETSARCPAPACYVPYGNRSLLPEMSDLETLG